jgi:glycosyltransferase involved in cell wall biosynthesis
MVVGLIAFASKQTEDSQQLRVFHETLLELQQHVDHVFVVDDGTGKIAVRGNNFTLKVLPQNLGKAGAIRHGLEMILGQQIPAAIAQIDYDHDQSPKDIPALLNKMRETQSDIVIGNRYNVHSENRPYRKRVNLFQNLICQIFGFDDVTDLVSGLWVYTGKFAQQFLSRSKSEGWGLNMEMATIARLVGAKVVEAPLSVSRNRGPATPTIKLLQSLDGILLHTDALRAKGYGILVEFLSDVRRKLDRRQEQFDIDLTPLGKAIKFRSRLLPGDTYTLEGND